MTQAAFFIIILFIKSLLSSRERVDQFENMLRQALSEYNLLPSALRQSSSTFSVEMQDEIKEHLAEITIEDSENKENSPLTLKINKSVSQPFIKQVYMKKEFIEDQGPVYLNLFQKIFTNPQKLVYFTSLEDIVYYFEFKVSRGNLTFLSLYENGIYYIKYKSREADVLMIKIQRKDELKEDLTYNMQYVLTFIYSLKNNVNYSIHEIDTFPETNEEINIDIRNYLATDDFINNNNSVLSNIMHHLPGQYEMKNVYLDQIQYDFNLGAYSQFFKLRTYNGSFIFASTYVEDEDKVGSFQLRVFKIDSYLGENYKLYQKNQLVEMDFYRIEQQMYKKLILNLRLDEQLNTLGYELAKTYIQEMQNSQQYLINKEEQFENQFITKDKEQIEKLPRFMERQVNTMNKQGQILYDFKYYCDKGNVNIQITDILNDDIYQMDFNVVNYNKNIMKNFIQSSIQLNKRIQES